MMWNIENFSINKLKPNSGDRSQMRESYITDTIKQVDPDILVVLEVSTGGGRQRGTVINDKGVGTNGILYLLEYLQRKDPAGKWCVVPPLILGDASTGMKEGVAVFFKNQNLDFRGPWQLEEIPEGGRPGQKRKKVKAGQSVSGIQPTTYDGQWQNALPKTAPAGGLIPSDDGSNQYARNQNQLAGRWGYSDRGQFLGFPNQSNRPPFQTTFIETGGTKRIINLYSVHTSPDTAAQAVEKIAQIPDIKAAAKANEIKIIAGDFNVNALDPNKLADYNDLTTVGYSLLFQEPTHLATVAHATTAGNNPFYGYMSQGDWRNPPTLPAAGVLRHCYDNFLIKGAAVQAQYVVNRVVGTAAQPPLPNITSELINKIAQINKINQNQDYKNGIFRRMENFGRVRGGSDHLPLCIEI